MAVWTGRYLNSSGGSGGRHAWGNSAFDDLVAQAGQLVGEPQRRFELYRRAEHILVDDVAAVFLWHPQVNELWKPHIKGLALEPNRFGYSAWRSDGLQNLSPTLYISQGDIF